MSSFPVLVLNSGSSSIKFAIYETADGQRTRLYDGAVDGIGTDNGKFWIKDGEGKKLVDQTPALPNRAVAFCLVSDALHSGDVPAPVVCELLRSLVLLLAPFAPYLAAELWEELGEQGAVLRAPWPRSNPELAKEPEIEIPVQINGKLVTVIRVPADASGEMIQAAALADEKVQARIAGRTIAKVIVVPRKTVNLVGR